MSISAFAVVSEFRFDVADAIIGTGKLQDKVDGLSNSVQGALDSVQALGMGFIANFSGSSAGILGFLGNAISMSDRFTQSQISFVQIIDSNMAHLDGTIGNMNEQMLTSRKIMNEIAGDARKFGLPANQLLQMTKTLSAMLVPKGLAGDNFSGARTMSRNLLKSAPNLGINPADVQGQLLRSIEGSASMGDTLFRRLITEAPESFKENNVTDAKSFNVLDAKKRFDILNESLSKFANNAKIVDMMANTLGGVMQSIRDLFMSFNSILKPLGDVILPPLIKVLQMAIKYLDNQGRQIVESMARFIKPLIENPREMLLNLQSLAGLSKDIAQAGGIVTLAVGLAHLGEILHFMSGIPILAGIVKPLQMLYDILLKLPVIGGILTSLTAMFNVGVVVSFGGAIKALGITLVKMAGLFAVLLIPIMGFTRAMARIKLDSLDWIANNMSGIIDSFASLKRSLSIMFSPIMDLITGWEELFYLIFSGTGALDGLKWTLDIVASGVKYLAETFLNMYASFRGIIAGIIDLFVQLFLNISMMIQNLMSGNFTDVFFGTENLFDSAMRSGAEEFMKTVDKFRVPTLGPEGEENAKVVNQVNNYDVKMNNSFKEVLQPDRIAFTIQDQLEKASRNRTSTRGGSIASQQARSI